MLQVFKYKLIKKYQDEIWGHLLQKKKYNYTKKLVLLNFKDFIKKLKYRVKIKYKYFKFFTFNYFSLISFKILKNKKNFLNFIKNYYYMHFYNNNLIYFLKLSYNNIYINIIYNINILKNLNILKNKNYLNKKYKINISYITQLFYKPSLNNYINNNITLNLYKNIDYNVKILKNIIRYNNNNIIKANYQYFYKISKFQYIIKKRLNLQRQKEFFYCVHIAAPEKKRKKWSLFGLKQIYYKKLSLFFGFIKVNKFINLYLKIKKIKTNSEYFFFLFLESRLETFLLRINFLPTIYFIKRFILNGNVFVNNKQIKYNNFILKPNNIVSIHKNKILDIYKSIKFNLKNKNIYLNSPKYIEVDYKLLVSMLTRKPTYNELTHPMSFDLYTSFLSMSK